MSRTHLTTQEFLKRLNQHFKNYQFSLITPFQGMGSPATFRCNHCGYIWKTKQARYILTIEKCPHCKYPKKNNRSKSKRQPKVPANLRLKHGQRMTPEFFMKRFNYTHPKSHIKLIGKWSKTTEPTTFQCQDCGYTWKIMPKVLNRRKIGCPHCAKKQRYQSMATPFSNFKEKIRKRFGYNKYEFLSKYKGTNHKLKARCKDCGQIRNVRASHYYDSNCPTCSANYRRMSLNEIQKRINQNRKQKTIKVLGYYQNYSSKFLVQCTKCRHKFWTTMNHLKTNNKGCPFCDASKSEKEIYHTFDNQNIDYQFEYKPKSLRNPKTNCQMHLDFYLPLTHEAIEFQGQQHYDPHWQGQKEFDKLQYRDSYKKQWCQKHHIKLHYITYKDNLKKSLQPILKEYLLHP